MTVSDPNLESYEPKVGAGGDADQHTAVVWTALNGANTRVQSSRRRDVVGFPRPKGATPTRTSLVPAYDACTSSNRTHGPPLAHPSCNPPVRSSSTLTVGSPDANGAAANSVASVTAIVLAGTPGGADDADVRFVVEISDVRNHPALTDYTGRVMANVTLRVTDTQASLEVPDPGTTQDFPFQFAFPCVTTADTAKGSDCNLTSTADALIPGAVTETKRTMWEMGQVQHQGRRPQRHRSGGLPADLR